MAQAIKLALAITFLAAMPAASSADVPTLNVEQTCRDSANADPTIPFDIRLCLDSENRARNELAGKWASFPEPDRQQCTQMASMGGTASYVELITCLEMDQQAREAREHAQEVARPQLGFA
jgi:hypothetical protein